MSECSFCKEVLKKCIEEKCYICPKCGDRIIRTDVFENRRTDLYGDSWFLDNKKQSTNSILLKKRNKIPNDEEIKSFKEQING